MDISRRSRGEDKLVIVPSFGLYILVQSVTNRDGCLQIISGHYNGAFMSRREGGPEFQTNYGVGISSRMYQKLGYN